MIKFIIVFVFVFASAHGYSFQIPITEGVVEGYKAADGDYYEFYGIAYAGPTDGIQRFKAPVPPAANPEVFHANVSTIRCAQPSASGLIGVENCLTLDIFSKNFTITKPVIVWLNAEDYTTTSTQVFSFRTFIEQDLVFVSVNFRLSIFGFLCLGIQEAPGNAGLRDVIQALKWLKSNIANFGGDPNNLVLMGHASGAAMVDLLTMSPQAKGLVHKGIVLSGSGLAPWAVAYDPVGYAELLGAKLGYTGKSKEELAKFLMVTNTTILNSALLEFNNFKNNTLLFAPCIENLTLNPNDTVLADTPLNLIHLGKYLMIPYITGYTSREGTMRVNETVFEDWLDGMNENFTEFLPGDLALSGEKAAKAADQIANYYFKGLRPQATLTNIDDYFKYEGDMLVAMPVIKGAKERSLTSTAEVRLFMFGYMGTYNSDWIYKDIPLKGVRHGGILNYLFDYDLKSDDRSTMESIVKRFAIFAYTGTQNSSIFEEWLPLTDHRINHIYYASNDNVNTFLGEIMEQLFGETMLLWMDLHYWFYKPPRPVNYFDENANSAGKNYNSFYIIFSSVICLMFINLV